MNLKRIYSEQPEALAAEGVRISKVSHGSPPFAKQTVVH